MSAQAVSGAGTTDLHRLFEHPPADDAPGSEWAKWYQACAWAATPKSCTGGGCGSGRHGNPGCAQHPGRGARLAELAMPPKLRMRMHMGLRNAEVAS